MVIECNLTPNPSPKERGENHCIFPAYIGRVDNGLETLVIECNLTPCVLRTPCPSDKPAVRQGEGRK